MSFPANSPTAALIHPPCGIIVFMMQGRPAPQIAMGTIYRGVVPLLLADFLVLVILTLFPALVLYLPGIMSP